MSQTSPAPASQSSTALYNLLFGIKSSSSPSSSKIPIFSSTSQQSSSSSSNEASSPRPSSPYSPGSSRIPILKSPALIPKQIPNIPATTSPPSKIPISLHRANSAKSTPPPKPQITIVQRHSSVKLSPTFYHFSPEPALPPPSRKSPAIPKRTSIFHRQINPLVDKRIASKSVLNIQKIDFLPNVLSPDGTSTQRAAGSGQLIFNFEKTGKLPESLRKSKKRLVESDSSDSESTTTTTSSSPLTPAFDSSPLFSSLLSPKSLEKINNSKMEVKTAESKEELKRTTSEEEFLILEKFAAAAPEKVPSVEITKQELEENLKPIENGFKESKPELAESINLEEIAEKILLTPDSIAKNLDFLVPAESLDSLPPKLTSLQIEIPPTRQPSSESINLETLAKKLVPSPKLPDKVIESSSESSKSPGKPPLPPASTSPLKHKLSFNRPKSLNLFHGSLNPKTPNNSPNTLIIKTESYSRTYSNSRSSISSVETGVDAPVSPEFGTLKRFHVTSSPKAEIRQFFPDSEANSENVSLNNNQEEAESPESLQTVPETVPKSPSTTSAIPIPSDLESEAEGASIANNLEQISRISFDLQTTPYLVDESLASAKPSTSKFPVANPSNSKPADQPTTSRGQNGGDVNNNNDQTAKKKPSKWKRFVKKLKFWKKL